MIRRVAYLVFCGYLALMVVAVATARPHVPAPPRWLARLIREHWPPSEWARAACIAWHESRYRPRAVSATDDHGLWQIHRGLAVYGPRIYRPAVNAAVAARMWREQGWTPWATRRWCE